MYSIDYLGAIGALMYLVMSTRPDIAYAVGVLTCFNANPGLAHWNVVKHLFCYQLVNETKKKKKWVLIKVVLSDCGLRTCLNSR